MIAVDVGAKAVANGSRVDKIPLPVDRDPIRHPNTGRLNGHDQRGVTWLEGSSELEKPQHDTLFGSVSKDEPKTQDEGTGNRDCRN